MVGLEPLDYINGIMGLIFVSITIIVGISILFKYFKSNNVNLLYVGIAWIFFCSGWYGTSISFIASFFNGGFGLPLEAILLINFIPLPFGLISWMIAYTDFMFKDKRKLFMSILCIYIAVFYIIFFGSLLTDVSQIATKVSAVDTHSDNIIISLILIIALILILLTGVSFSLKTIKIGNPEMKVKGKFLLVAFFSFVIGAILDAIMPTSALSLILLRILLISSALEFYIGFILPEMVKKFLLKEK